MNEIEKNIAKLFLEKLSTSRLNEIPSNLDLDAGRTLSEKDEALLQNIGENEEELHRLIVDGFDGLYHQTIYFSNGTHIWA